MQSRHQTVWRRLWDCLLGPGFPIQPLSAEYPAEYHANADSCHQDEQVGRILLLHRILTLSTNRTGLAATWP
jgi:hypothetical protein